MIDFVLIINTQLKGVKFKFIYFSTEELEFYNREEKSFRVFLSEENFYSIIVQRKRILYLEEISSKCLCQHLSNLPSDALGNLNAQLLVEKTDLDGESEHKIPITLVDRVLARVAPEVCQTFVNWQVYEQIFKDLQFICCEFRMDSISEKISTNDPSSSTSGKNYQDPSKSKFSSVLVDWYLIVFTSLRRKDPHFLIFPEFLSGQKSSVRDLVDIYNQYNPSQSTSKQVIISLENGSVLFGKFFTASEVGLSHTGDEYQRSISIFFGLVSSSRPNFLPDYKGFEEIILSQKERVGELIEKHWEDSRFESNLSEIKLGCVEFDSSRNIAESGVVQGEKYLEKFELYDQKKIKPEEIWNSAVYKYNSKISDDISLGLGLSRNQIEGLGKSIPFIEVGYDDEKE